MQHSHPTPDQFRALKAMPQDSGPIEMINLLRFRARAEYPEGSDFPPCSGREAYTRYPSVGAFLAITTDPAYIAIAVHRTAALADSRLIMNSRPA